MSKDGINLIGGYRRLHEVTNQTYIELTSKDFYSFFVAAARGTPVRLGVDKVVRLGLDLTCGRKRDHFIQVHLTELETRLFREGYPGYGSMVSLFRGNYSVETEERKIATILDGFPFRIATVSSAEEIRAITPLKNPSDSEYTERYERLMRS